MLQFAEIACPRSNVGGDGGGEIILVPFALTATGSGASYWYGIVLAMAAWCLDAHRWIGTRAAPSLRFVTNTIRGRGGGRAGKPASMPARFGRADDDPRRFRADDDNH